MKSICKFYFIIFFLNQFELNSQRLITNFPVDTSFTIYSAFQKAVTQFPNISLAKIYESDEIEIIENLVYNTIGQRELHLDIFKRKNLNENLPLILIIHGGGWKSGNKSMEHSTASHLAKYGFITAAIEYRLSPEALFPASIIDLKNSLVWLKRNSKQFNIDTNNIFIMGFSSGGHLASLLGLTYNKKIFDKDDGTSIQTKIKGVINIDGVVDLTDPSESGKDTIKGKLSAAAQWLGCTFKENQKLWMEASPVNYVDDNCPSFLFINSSIERFHAGRDKLFERLKKFNKYFEVHTIPNTPHTFWLFHPWFETVQSIINNFINKNMDN